MSATAVARVPPVEPIKVVASILQSEMGLSADQILLSYQKFNIDPKTTGILLDLNYVMSQEIANTNLFDDATLTEIQEVVMRHLIQVDILSFDASARIRKEEVAMALRSMASQNLQEKNIVGVAWLQQDFINATSLEQTKLLNRFTTTVAVQAIHRIEKGAPFYDQFDIEADLLAQGQNTPTTEHIDPTEQPDLPEREKED